jgi:hypothetical protein
MSFGDRISQMIWKSESPTVPVKEPDKPESIKPDAQDPSRDLDPKSFDKEV